MQHSATHKLSLHPPGWALPLWVALSLIPSLPMDAATPLKAGTVKPAPPTNPFEALFAPKPQAGKTPTKPGAKPTPKTVAKTTPKPAPKPALKAKPLTASTKKPVARPSITPAKSGTQPKTSPTANKRAYPMSEVSMNQWLLGQFHGANSRLVVDLSKQKAYLLINEKIALTTPVSSARAGMSTPTGDFRMSERVRSGKISNLYHVGMPFWMRLGSTPYGTHAGFLPGYPASHGCIRLPYPVAETIFDHTQLGTRVSVYHSWNR